MVDEIAGQEPKAERSLMHRFNIALVRTHTSLPGLLRHGSPGRILLHSMMSLYACTRIRFCLHSRCTAACLLCVFIPALQ